MGLKSRVYKITAFFLPALLLFYACAVQQTPTGGEKDETPPRLLSTNPENETLNFKAEEIELLFDEYIQLKNAFQEISISPDPDSRPEFRTKKNAIIIEFTDSLEANTTYQINFGNAISDMNESNPFPNYKYVFSTGNQIDSLRIRGSVGSYGMGKIDPKNNDLHKILVFIHTHQDTISNQDSLVMMKKPGYYTYADSSGNFEITNLKEGTYHLYALLEENGSRIYDEKEELIAFLDRPLKLSGDTTIEKMLLATLEQQNLEVLDERNDGPQLTLLLNKRTDSLRLNILSPPQFDANKIVENSDASDSVIVWLPSADYDSLSLAVGDQSAYIDTLIFRNFREESKPDPFTISDNLSSGALAPGKEVMLIASRPLSPPAANRIELQEDSVKISSQNFSLERVSPRKYKLIYPWKEQHKYQITIGASYLSDIYTAGNEAYQKQFFADSLENYGNISINYSVSDTLSDSVSYLVQLLSSDYGVMQSDVINSTQSIDYKTLKPAKYLIRVIYDRNRNGRWDGSYLFQKIQPEKILVFDPGENLRANWDQEYNIEIPADDP